MSRSLNVILLLLLLSSAPCPSSSFLPKTTMSTKTTFEQSSAGYRYPARHRHLRLYLPPPPSSSLPFPRQASIGSRRIAIRRSDRRPLAIASSSDQSSDEDEVEPQLDEGYLKAELTRYLQVREQSKADEKSGAGATGEDATKKKKKVAGGSRGNKILEYVSAVPGTIDLDDEGEANPFDYDELTRYGFGNVVKMLMRPGIGRRRAYEVMDMPPPAAPDRLRPKPVPELVIDREGYTDPARYKGLKMSQATSDDAIGEALESIRRRKEKDEEVSERPRLLEEDYVQPFADKRNVGPRPASPEWTAEMLDEEGRKRGRAIAWARRAEGGEMRGDPLESPLVEGAQRAYCASAALFVAFAYGGATPLALSTFLGMGRFADGDNSIQLLLDGLRIPALAVVLAAIGSGVVCGTILAPQKRRNPLVWAVKGFAGGPITVNQLRGLDVLQRNDEEEEERP